MRDGSDDLMLHDGCRKGVFSAPPHPRVNPNALAMAFTT